jgi:hypothetical protein
MCLFSKWDWRALLRIWLDRVESKEWKKKKKKSWNVLMFERKISWKERKKEEKRRGEKKRKGKKDLIGKKEKRWKKFKNVVDFF